MKLCISWIKAVDCDDVDIGILWLYQISEEILRPGSLQNLGGVSTENIAKQRAKPESVIDEERYSQWGAHVQPGMFGGFSAHDGFCIAEYET